MRKKIVGSICCILLVTAVLLAAGLFFRPMPMLYQAEHPRISAISVTVGEAGHTYDADISENLISEELSDTLVDLFVRAKMRRRIFSPPQTYSAAENSVYITVKVVLEGGDYLSMRVNLSTEEEYNSAQFGDTHFLIINSGQLYQEVYAQVKDLAVLHAEMR